MAVLLCIRLAGLAAALPLAAPAFADYTYIPYVFYGLPTPVQTAAVYNFTGSSGGFVTGTSDVYHALPNGDVYQGPFPWIASLSHPAALQLGLTTAPYLNPYGYDVSSILSHDGPYVYGRSTLAGDPGRPYTLWMFNTLTAGYTTLGLYDAAHTSSTGRFSNTLLGSVGSIRFGYASHYNGTTGTGISTWEFDPATGLTTDISFTDPAHTSVNGSQFTQIAALNSSTLVLTVVRYDPDGQHNELFRTDPSLSFFQPLGLIDPQHLSAAGSRSNTLGSNNGVYYGGASERFDGALDLGQDSWFYNNDTGTVTPAGLTDPEHLAANGYRTNALVYIAPGYAAGTATRFGDAAKGTDSFLYNMTSGQTTLVGPIDAAHTRSDGYRNILVTRVDTNGHAIGNAAAYTSGDPATASQDAWFFDTSAHLMGLSGGQFLSNAGIHSSSAREILNDHQAIGSSQRYPAVGSPTTTYFCYDVSTGVSTPIGLYDDPHTRASDGLQSNALIALRSFAVTGSAQRFDTGSSDYWYFDPASLTTYLLPFQSNFHLNDDGTVDGSYLKAGTTGTFAGRWSPATGLVDLSDLYRPLLDELGLDHLISLTFAADGDLQGYAVPVNAPAGSRAAVVLVPAPEPATALLLLVAAPLLLRRQSRWC